MKREVVLGIILAFLLLTVSTSEFNFRPSKSTFARGYVRGDSLVQDDAPVELLSDSIGYAIENSMVRFESDSGIDNQGPYTIVNGFNKQFAYFPDFVWFGEYEYVSPDGGFSWVQLSVANGVTRTLTENVAGKDYTIDFDTTSSPLAGLDIKKRIALLTDPDRPLANITYTIESPTPMNIMLYYSIDYCDAETTGDARDDVFDWASGQVVTAQWFNDVNGLLLDTQASGYGVLETWPETADFYAGYWMDALYQIWGTGYNIDDVDAGIGVVLNFGTVGFLEVSKGLYIGVSVGPWLPPPESPQFPPTAAFFWYPLTPKIGTTVTFDASPSFDPDGTIVSYWWDFGDGNITNVSVPTIIHNYALDGTYNVVLTIIDNEGNIDTATAFVTVLPLVHDVALINMARSKTVVGQGYPVSINATVQDQGDYPETFDVTLYAQSEVPPINDAGLVGHWKFDEGIGTTAQDSTDNGNTGTLVNGPTWVDGRYGKALSFDGVDDYVEMTENTDLDPRTRNWTISAWVNIRRLSPGIYGYPIYGFVIAGKRQSPDDRSLTLLVHSGTSQNSPARFSFILDGPFQAAGAQSEEMNVFGWHHIVGVRKGGELYVCVDGVEYGPNNYLFDGGQITPTTDVNSTTPIRLATHYWAQSSESYDGIIDDVRIYERALNEEEIRTLAIGFPIQTQTVTLGSGAYTTLTFTWNTAGFAYDNYTISAYATPVSGEIDIADNTLTDGIVAITIAGDINGDKIVNNLDLTMLNEAFGSSPDKLNWNPNADINNDSIVNVIDLFILSKNYGKTT